MSADDGRATRRSIPRGFVVYASVINLCALAMTVWLAARPTAEGRLWVVALLCATAVLFEEISTRVARLRLRLSLDMKRDMISVWAVAVAVSLNARNAALALLVVLAFVWFRHQRPSGERLLLKAFNASTIVIAVVAAGYVYRTVVSDTTRVTPGLEVAGGIVLAMVIYAIINRGLVSPGVLLLGAPLRSLAGSLQDNLIESATISLGGLVALAIYVNPWLMLLTVVPLVALQRGAVVHELENFATTDAKTGLLNAIALEHVGQREVARAERAGTALSVVIVDIDHFKRVNDRFGHLVGDAVLKGVARALQDEVREYDTLSRFGGEEFVALLPGTTESEAMAAAERLRARVAQLRVSEFESSVEPTPDDGLSVSIGVSCFGVDGMQLSDLLFTADAALYRAKAAGRNQVLLADRGDGEHRAAEQVPTTTA